MSRSALIPLSLCLAALTGTAQASDRAPLRIASWGGAYQDVQTQVFFAPFTSRTGVPVETVALKNPLETLRAAAGNGTITVADLPDADADAACAEQLLEPLDVAFFDKSASAAAGPDFLMPPTPCGIPSSVISEVMVYSRAAFGAKTPARVADLFDTVNFPGKRAFKRDAMGTFEWALMADGVTPGEVYNVLATSEGVDRVFAKLETIRNDAQWWDRSDVPLTWLARGDVVMAAAYSTWAYQAIVGEHLPLAIVWPGALSSANRWVIVKGASDPAAREFIKFATDTARVADFARQTPYGAVRRSATAVAVPEMSDYAPTSPEHLAITLPLNVKFWREQGAPLRQRFEVWLQAAQANTAAASQAPASDAAEHKESHAN